VTTSHTDTWKTDAITTTPQQNGNEKWNYLCCAKHKVHILKICLYKKKLGTWDFISIAFPKYRYNPAANIKILKHGVI